MNYLLAIAIVLASPEPEEYRYQLLPDAVIVLDGRVIDSLSSVPKGSELVVTTKYDFYLFGRRLLRGPAWYVEATSPRRKP